MTLSTILSGCNPKNWFASTNQRTTHEQAANLVSRVAVASLAANAVFSGISDAKKIAQDGNWDIQRIFIATLKLGGGALALKTAVSAK